MPSFNVLSGTWYHVTAPDFDTARDVYNLYFNGGRIPDGCDIKEGEVDSHWIPVDLDGQYLTLEEYESILRTSHIPNKTTIAAMKEALGEDN